jgi:hypothetical protein
LLLFWPGAAALALVALLIIIRTIGRTARVRSTVLLEVRRLLRGGVIEKLPRRGQQARGRLGELEITVDLYEDPQRRSQSPMWRVLAVGPVRIDPPIEARVAGWQGWIDSWLQLGETLVIHAGVGPEFTVHSEQPRTDHRVVTALRHQGASLGPGALHARPDLMRAEVRFRPRHEDNHALFAYLHAMAEISEQRPARMAREATRHAVRLRRVGSAQQEVR